ncbi:MAG: 50S ribosomal protein L24 [Candidatus Moraniibacteriota bacterium]|nr:MAG: 50S ribosomal protein L24 [Candidatus Moranbacteria bacterium]
MKFKKGDEVEIITGKDKGKRGPVSRTVPTLGQIVVEGVNVRKKHIKSRKEGQKGERVEISSPFSISKAMLVCPHTGKLTRIGYQMESGEKIRISKRANKPIA